MNLQVSHERRRRIHALAEMNRALLKLSQALKRALVRVEFGRAAAERDGDSLRASEERFRTLTETLPHYVIGTDTDGAVTFVSRSYADFTGLPGEKFLGAGWMDVMHPDDLPQLAESWRSAVKSRRPYRAEARVRRADGAYRWHVA